MVTSAGRRSDPNGHLTRNFGLGVIVVLIVASLWLSNQAANDKSYLGKVHSTSYRWNNTDAELVTMAHNVCGAFDKAKTVKQIVASFYGLSPAQEGYIMGAAVSVYCPSHWNTMASEINAYVGR